MSWVALICGAVFFVHSVCQWRWVKDDIRHTREIEEWSGFARRARELEAWNRSAKALTAFRCPATHRD